MDHHMDVEATQNDGRCRFGEEENDPGITDQSERDDQEVCDGSDKKRGTGSSMRWHQL